MHIVIFAFLLLAVVYLVLRLRNTRVQLWEAWTNLSQLQAENERPAQPAAEDTADRAAIWAHANTIHLLASLSEEACGDPSVKENQAQIRLLAQQIQQNMEH